MKKLISKTAGPILAADLRLSELGTKYYLIKEIQVCSNEGPTPLSIGDNSEIVKIHERNSKIFLSRTAEPISTKLATKHHFIKRFQVCSHKGPRRFPNGNINEKQKFIDENLKIFSRRAGPIQINWAQCIFG